MGVIEKFDKPVVVEVSVGTEIYPAVLIPVVVDVS
jgi:hypothetical protein